MTDVPHADGTAGCNDDVLPAAAVADVDRNADPLAPSSYEEHALVTDIAGTAAATKDERLSSPDVPDVHIASNALPWRMISVAVAS